MNQPRSRNTRPLTSITLCMALFWVLAFVAFRMQGLAALADRQTREEMFLRIGQSARADLEESLHLDQEFLQSLAGLFVASPDLDREQFASFVQFGDNREHISGVLYAQEVSRSRISRWEERRQGRAGLHVRGLDGEGRTVTLVNYVEPGDRLASAEGMNLYSDPVWAEALTTARDSSRVTATPPGPLDALGVSGTGILVIVPIFASPDPGTSVEARRREHLGYGVLVYQLPRLFEHWRPGDRFPTGIACRVLDVTDINSYQTLTRQGDPGGTAPRFAEAYDFQVGDRLWRMIWQADNRFAAAGGWTPKLILVLGLGVALALCALFYLLIIRHSQARSEVRVRTLQLEASEEEVQRTLDALRTANDQLRHMNEQKSEFLSTVSHELRTPLTVISEYVQMILSDQVGTIEGDAREFLGIAQHQLHRVNRMIAELLDFARLEAESLVLRPRFTDVNSILTLVQDFFRPSAAGADIDLFIATCEGLAPLWIDPDRLEQILGNLVSNSLKFTPPGGGVRVFAAGDDVHVVFLVEDDGPGISGQDQERLFERFYQVRTDKGNGSEGAGLGLAIAKALTEIQGGDITVQSETGQGSCFVVRFPVLTAAQVEHRVCGEIADAVGILPEEVQGRVGSLPAGSDTGQLEEWIRTHVPQDGSYRIIHRYEKDSVLILFAGPEEHVDAVAARSRAVFPLVQWEHHDPAGGERRAA